MTGPFRRARVEGTFTGEDLRAWDTTWGAGERPASCTKTTTSRSANGVVRRGDSEIRTDGLFSLVTPRPDGGDEIDAQFRVTRRDLDSLRHAFQIDEYPLSGRMSGEFHLKGERRRPIGFGTMTIDEGVAYGEPIQNATASLRFDGTGVRLDGIEIAKGTGTITGAAFVGWDSTYSFNADGRRIPVGAAGVPDLSRRSAVGHSSSCRRPATARSTCRATISSSASAIWPSTRKPSGRSPAISRCAARI